MRSCLAAAGLWAVLLVGLSHQAVNAEPITYIESGVGSGTLGALGFNDTAFTITLVSDTTTVISASGVFANLGTATLSISGGPTVTFTEQLAAFDSQGDQAAGIGSAPQMIPVLGTVDGAFASYGLTASIGPISNTPAFSPGASFSTDNGLGPLFSLTSVTSSSFSAIAVPEPSSVALLGMAAAALIASVRRLRRA